MLHPSDLAIAHGYQVRPQLIDFETSRASARFGTNEDQYLVPAVDEPLRHLMHVLEGVENAIEELHYAVDSVVGPLLKRARHYVPLDLRIGDALPNGAEGLPGIRGVEGRVVGRVTLAHDLDVLLRHTPAQYPAPRGWRGTRCASAKHRRGSGAHTPAKRVPTHSGALNPFSAAASALSRRDAPA